MIVRSVVNQIRFKKIKFTRDAMYMSNTTIVSKTSSSAITEKLRCSVC